jgi:hypothetical protein
MKRFGRFALMLSLCLAMPGCNGCRNQFKHMQSEVVGLNRKVTLYGADGSVIREWKTTAKVEDRGGSCWFIGDDGKTVTVSGNFVIEEL